MAAEDQQTPLKDTPLEEVVPDVPPAGAVGKHAAAAEQTVHAAVDQSAPADEEATPAPQPKHAAPVEQPASSAPEGTHEEEAPEDTTQPQEPVNAPGRATIPVEGRAGADATCGKNAFISWGARSDVGLVRSHNEDSFLIRTPCFAVCDGMGGHAAGEVASSIAVETIGEKAPATADDTLLGAAIEAANQAVIKGAEEGRGKPGMGCTASAALIDGNRMAIAHVGDSRIYLLHAGTLVRVTRDHSYVEELVDAGQITADEARVHPSRSIITRALGSDPDMYADHFSIEVSNGDRVILCSDGLSSMVPDSEIESLAVSSATPQQAANNLVSAALTAGGADNITVIVVDVLNDGVAAAARKHSVGFALRVVVAMVLVAVVVFGGIFAFAKNEWYLGVDGDTVGIYQGIDGEVLGISLSNLVQTTAVEVSDLPANVATQLEHGGVRVDSEQEALSTVESYRTQIDAEKTKAAEKAAEVTAEGNPTGEAAPADGTQTTESGTDSGADSANGDTATTADTTGDTTQTNGGE
ncbi:protein phosphatase [Tractidigestivibacter scatoligenes]|uniref:Protein phosphatase n=1 Tax=Tractidigestivibacter scatoligenes TaxID=1299998 RepID=A0A100YWD9_TRASO|nr:Stp1/IreP family PP2C-type Ser/Thr phosphatase [Tractidigestivibacter scatoligenes]KUH58923.1 protein phosphatase [Tractidigestivibacter scatoligenes]